MTSALIVKILDIDKQPGVSNVTLASPDENGPQVTWPVPQGDELENLLAGGQFSVALIPVNQTVAGPRATDHPLVMDAGDAEASEPATTADIAASVPAIDPPASVPADVPPPTAPAASDAQPDAGANSQSSQ